MKNILFASARTAAGLYLALFLLALAGCAAPGRTVKAQTLDDQAGIVARIEAHGPMRLAFDRTAEAPDWNSLLLENQGTTPVGDIRLRRSDGTGFPAFAAESDPAFALLPGGKFACTAANDTTAPACGRLLGVMLWDMPTSPTALGGCLHRVRAARLLPGRGIALDAAGGESFVEFAFAAPVPSARIALSWRTSDKRTNPAVWISLDGAAWTRVAGRRGGSAMQQQGLELTEAVRGARRFFLRLSWGGNLSGTHSNGAMSGPKILLLTALRLQREFEAAGELPPWPTGRNTLVVEYAAPPAPPPTLEVRLVTLK